MVAFLVFGWGAVVWVLFTADFRGLGFGAGCGFGWWIVMGWVLGSGW